MLGILARITRVYHSVKYLTIVFCPFCLVDTSRTRIGQTLHATANSTAVKAFPFELEMADRVKCCVRSKLPVAGLIGGHEAYTVAYAFYEMYKILLPP